MTSKSYLIPVHTDSKGVGVRYILGKDIIHHYNQDVYDTFLEFAKGSARPLITNNRDEFYVWDWIKFVKHNLKNF